MDENFRNIMCKDKISVDINGNATFTMTTDKFFSNNTQNFDIIFIDADHDHRSVIKDLNNSLLYARLYIFLHDMYPMLPEHAVPSACGDSYKLLYYLVKKTNFVVKTLNSDSGLTLLRPTISRVNIDSIDYPSDYNTFVNEMSDYKRLTVEEMKATLRR